MLTGTKEYTTLIEHLKHLLAFLGARISPTFDTFSRWIGGGKVIFPVIFVNFINNSAGIIFNINGC
jgi:hypothetical protein